MEEDSQFLPEKVELPLIPTNWNPKSSIETIQGLTSAVKPKVETIVCEFWIAHEQIVNKRWEGWTWGRFCKETGYSHDTPLNWFQKYGLEYTRSDRAAESRKLENSSLDKPPKKRTKPETKFQLEETVELIKAETISDDDLKMVGDALADKVTKGEAAPRVGTKVATAVKKAFKGKEVKQRKDPDNFQRLQKHALALMEGLQFWADGTIKPETEDEATAAKIILDQAPAIITHYSRIGINILSIYDTFIDPHKESKNGRELRKAISV